MTSPESDAGRRARLEAKLAPARIRANLAFAGLFQFTHELIKRGVLDDVKGFYGYMNRLASRPGCTDLMASDGTGGPCCRWPKASPSRPRCSG